MWIPLLNLLLIKFCFSKANDLRLYSEDRINMFINSAAEKLNLSTICRSSLLKVHNFLTAYDTIREQHDLFYASYATSGTAKLILSRDRSRWHYRLMECLHVPAETLAVASEYPMMYCNAYKDLLSDNSSAFGLCLPATCFPDKLQLARFWVTEYTESTNETSIETVQCTQSRHTKQWYERLGPVTDFVVNKLFITLVMCSTIYQATRETTSKSVTIEFFLAFSLIRTFKAITHLPKKEQKPITCIFGLRLISTLWVMLGHSSIFIQEFLENVDEYRESLKNNFFNQIITNCFLSVDTFFLISGTLTSYSWFRSRQRTDEPMNISYWLQFYWHRVVRLWPAYAYVMLVVVMRFTLMDYRPVWKLDDQGDKCASEWWKNLLFINSITDDNCMPWTWYIGTDFIFYLLAPIYLLSFKKSYTLGMAVSVATIALTAAINIILMWLFNFPPAQMLWVMPTIFNLDFMEQHRVMYIRPECRIGPYIIGIMLGYYLVTSKDEKLSSRRSVCCGWLFFGLFSFVSLFGLYPALQGWHWWFYYRIYAAFYHVTWAIAIAWLIFACHRGRASYVNRFLSLSIFIPLSANCYSSYLCHMFPIIAVFTKAPFPIVYRGIQTLLGYFMIQVIFSNVLGFFTMIVIEYPFMNIQRTMQRMHQLRDGQINHGTTRQYETSNNNGILEKDLLLHRKELPSLQTVDNPEK